MCTMWMYGLLIFQIGYDFFCMSSIWNFAFMLFAVGYNQYIQNFHSIQHCTPGTKKDQQLHRIYVTTCFGITVKIGIEKDLYDKWPSYS